jgi:hypothetical protein
MAIEQRNSLLPALFVMATGAATFLLCGILSYALGLHAENSRQFLKNYRAPNLVEALSEISWRYAHLSDEANAVLFVGDSAMHCGLDPIVFEQLTGLRAYNLATMEATGVDGTEVLLREYLAHHPRPRLVVFGSHPRCMAHAIADVTPVELEIHDAFIWAYGPRDEANRPRHDMPIDYYASQGVWQLCGLLTEGTTKWANSLGSGYPGSFNALLANVNARRGQWQLTGKSDHELPPPPMPPVSLEKRDDLIHLAEFCQARGIAFLLCTTPYRDGERAEFADLERFLQSTAEKSAAVSLNEPLLIKLPGDKFFDPAHCNAAGAEEFTRIVAEGYKSMLKLVP